MSEPVRKHYRDDLPSAVQTALEELAGALGQLRDPASGKTLDQLPADIELDFTAGTLCIDLILGYPCSGANADWEGRIRSTCAPLLATGPLMGASLRFKLSGATTTAPAGAASGPLAGVKNLIAVASGKGGVGKSTTAVNLALALAAEGANTGLLDADIYGPSLPTMVGTSGQRPQVAQQKWFIPVPALGLKTMSLGYLTNARTPAVWRGPMASGALNQMLTQTLWTDGDQPLDYLIIDMPPGTGDIQLTLAQKVTLAGAVIVTTPQDLALVDAVKGVEMFRKVAVPVLGIVENMALHTCSSCGHQEAVFGRGGGAEIAERYGVSLLGQLPLAMSIRAQADSGTPTVAAQPESEIALCYRDMARRIAAAAWLQSDDMGMPEIEIT